MIQIRTINDTDKEAIDAYVNARVWERAEKKWVTTIDSELIRTACKNENPDIHSVIIEETYLLLFSIVKLWFSSEQFLEEKLLIKLLDGPGKFSDVTKAFDQMAQNLRIDHIVVGTAMAPNDKALVRMYMRNGFEQSATGLYKQIET
jgi:hypothetical protein